MSVVIRPRFGRPCFWCERTVPMQRVQALQGAADEAGRALFKNEIVCVGCQREIDAFERKAGEATVIKPRRK
jgi:hypothetical protein